MPPKEKTEQTEQQAESVTEAASPSEVQDNPHDGLTREKCIERGLDPSCYGFDPVAE